MFIDVGLRASAIVLSVTVAIGCGRVGYDTYSEAGPDGAANGGAGGASGSGGSGGAKADSGLDAAGGTSADSGADADSGPCTPTTCNALGANCGTPSDGCGKTLNCGTCAAPQTCGGGGITGICGPDRSWAIPDTGSYAESFTPEIVSDNAAATIFYTNDGTTPTTSSPSSTGLVPSVTFTSGTPVQFFAKSSAGTQSVQSQTYTIDASLQVNRGFVPTQSDLGSGSPLAIVAPGAPISGTIHLHEWGDCPQCIVQVVSAIEGTAVACLTNHISGVYPGMTETATLSLTAPTTPGTYFVYASVFEQLNCASALALYTATFPRRLIGVIIVK